MIAALATWVALAAVGSLEGVASERTPGDPRANDAHAGPAAPTDPGEGAEADAAEEADADAAARPGASTTAEEPAASAVTLPPLGPWSVPTPPVPVVHPLRSGVPVWFVHRDDVPLVRVEVSLRRGQVRAEDPLALQLAAVLLDEGTAGHPRGAWSREVDALTVSASLGTSTWRSWGDVELLVGDEDRALALLSEALREPSLRGRDVRRLRRAWVRSGRLAWTSSDTVTAAARARAEYAPGHPLAEQWGLDDYRRLTPRRVRSAWTDEIATPDAAIVVVGAALPESLMPHLERHLGWLEPGWEPVELPAPPPDGERLILVDHPGVRQARVVLSMPAPGLGDPLLPAAEVVAQAWCGGFTSRLNQRLREAEGWSYGVACAVEARPGFGRLVVTAPVAPEATGEAVRAMRELLDEAADTLPTEPEWTAARRALLLEAARDAASRSRLAWRLGRHLTHGRAAGAEAQAAQALRDTDLQAARAAARLVLGGSDRLWLVVADAAVVEASLDAAGLAPDHRWSGRSVVAPP